MAIRNPALPKHPADRAEYRVPWDPWLCDGSVLQTVVSVESDRPTELIVSDIRLIGETTVGYVLTGGIAPTDYDVTVTVETTRIAGTRQERLARIFPVRVRD